MGVCRGFRTSRGVRMGKGNGHAVGVVVAGQVGGCLAADGVDVVVGSKRLVTRVVTHSIDLRYA